MQQPDLGSTKGTKVAITRIVTYNLITHAEHEYLYPLDNPDAAVSGAVYDGANGGLLIGGKSLEATVGKQDTVTATATLAADGITPVGKSLYLDLGALLGTLNPAVDFFGHDKIEGVAARDGGHTLVISNDSDFGLGEIANATPPYALIPKILPDGTQDDGQYLVINMDRLPASTSTATVTLTVG